MQLKTQKSKIFLEDNSFSGLKRFSSSWPLSQFFILVDDNTYRHCYSKLKTVLPGHHVIKIKPGERNKTLKTCEQIWKKLTAENADRQSILINVGGGVIGDIGGFVAGCYKRRIKFVNIPTTLLAMVDASVGGKTSVNFYGFKNQIGLFNEPEAVFINTGFLKTLPDRELRAGLYEVIKHYVIADANAFNKIFKLVFPNSGKEGGVSKLDWDALVKKNIAIKSKIVSKDKYESGVRKALNFGHTIGHAVETLFLKKGKSILHGEAVAIGIICESNISLRLALLSKEEFLKILITVSSLNYSLPVFHKNSTTSIVHLIMQDKKNNRGKNQFTLLKSIGKISMSHYVEESIIRDSLKYYNEMFTKH